MSRLCPKCNRIPSRAVLRPNHINRKYKPISEVCGMGAVAFVPPQPKQKKYKQIAAEKRQAFE